MADFDYLAEQEINRNLSCATCEDHTPHDCVACSVPGDHEYRRAWDRLYSTGLDGQFSVSTILKIRRIMDRIIDGENKS